ncbi:hypothetical protein Ga0123462_0706 [Mariprofundus ferrinatatus]|uniref:Cytochrome oxidase subunit II copper A binding domain-containing protein n=1 Tax=Mariprofundus ferrinatatus TaxID=1921087 RepID=A0A2K8LBF5_9PROT|nr:hypothetical protein [Mariprofundus ferrinatatus]ATX81576.1 hypothetical protein Ga0123462_0706 [Mariprofundus ferrinatatus]
MSQEKPNKGLNYKLLLVTIVFCVAVGVPVVMNIKAKNPDMTVTKEKITREDLVGFQDKVKQMVETYTVRVEGETPVVHPPAGSDIYLLAKNYDWGNFTLELEKGQTYRLHLATLDMKHAIVVRELKLMNRIKVGEFKTLEFAPIRAGRFDIICGEFCGAGHASMVGSIIVTDTTVAAPEQGVASPQ